MRVNITRFSLPTGEHQVRRMGVTNALDPNPLGDWCRYEDVKRLIESLEVLTAPPARLYPNLCNHKIEVPETRGIRVMYCNLTIGHEGACKP